MNLKCKECGEIYVLPQDNKEAFNYCVSCGSKNLKQISQEEFDKFLEVPDQHYTTVNIN